MSQLIYLSRHGIVKINTENIPSTAPDAYDLLEEGVKECRNLGEYLSTCHISNPFFVDSSLPRTVASTHLVAESMGINLTQDNYLSCSNFEEDVPWEVLSPEQKEYYCSRHRNRPIKLAQELGAEVHQELCRIGKVFSENNLIAILHGGINLGLIAYLTGQLKWMHNCGLYVLERTEDRLRVVSDYISVERMRKELESGRIKLVEQALR